VLKKPREATLPFTFNMELDHGEIGCEEVVRTYLAQNGKNGTIIRYPWNSVTPIEKFCQSN
jgi:hypothetical protein